MVRISAGKKSYDFKFGIKSDRKFQKLAEAAGLIKVVAIPNEDGINRYVKELGPDYENEWIDYQYLAAYWAANDKEMTIDELVDIMDSISMEDAEKLYAGFFSHVGLKKQQGQIIAKEIVKIQESVSKAVE